MKIVYFAWLRQKTGIDSENITIPPEVSNVGELIHWLKDRNENFASALSDLESIRIAVNQEFAESDAPLTEGDEVAIFPPMTGG